MKILKDDDEFKLVAESIEVASKIPVGLYDIDQDPARQFFLKRRPVDEFIIPGKIYGDNTIVTDRVKKSYEAKDRNLGVLFIGEKGTGKTLIAKKLCNEMELPVVIINRYFDAGELIKFLTAIPCPAIIFIDEFEKIYDTAHQNDLLTLMDGTSDNRFLFLFTGNDPNRINRHLKNRPSRIKYLVEFNSLEASFIEEMIDDLLKDKDKHYDNVIKITNVINTVNYDALQTIIEEINMFGNSDVNVLLNLLNVSPENTRFDIILTDETDRILEDYISHNPLIYDFSISGYYSEYVEDPKDKDHKILKYSKDYGDIQIELSKITDLKITSSGYTFKYKGSTVICSKQEERKLVY